MKIGANGHRALKFLVNALSLSFWLLMLFGFNSPCIAVLTFISAAIHECGHIGAMLHTGNYRGLPYFALSGMRLRSASGIGYRDELIILCAGPLANFAAFFILYLLSKFFGEYIYIFALLNLLTGISNLLPVEGYDGYKIINALVNMTGGGAAAYRVLRATSQVLLGFLTFLSLYLILKVGEGYWIFGIFFVSMLLTLFKAKNIKKENPL